MALIRGNDWEGNISTYEVAEEAKVEYDWRMVMCISNEEVWTRKVSDPITSFRLPGREKEFWERGTSQENPNFAEKSLLEDDHYDILCAVT